MAGTDAGDSDDRGAPGEGDALANWRYAIAWGRARLVAERKAWNTGEDDRLRGGLKMEDFRKKSERNARVQARYDELMREGRHGHYETLFRIVREEVESLEADRDAAVAHGARMAALWEAAVHECEALRERRRRD